MRRARSSAIERPDLTLVYLPHLDYDPQRFGPSGCDLPRLVGELDDACAPLLDAAEAVGARVWVVSEYGHCDVSRPVLLNRVLRQAGLLAVRPGPFGESSTRSAAGPSPSATTSSPTSTSATRTTCHGSATCSPPMPGVARVLAGDERAEIGSTIPAPANWSPWPSPTPGSPIRSGSTTATPPTTPGPSTSTASPATTPASCSSTPSSPAPKLRAVRRLIQKKLGFRTLFDVIPLDPSLVRGSHGLPAAPTRTAPS